MNADEACPQCGGYSWLANVFNPDHRYCLDCDHEWHVDQPPEDPPYLG